MRWVGDLGLVLNSELEFGAPEARGNAQVLYVAYLVGLV